MQDPVVIYHPGLGGATATVERVHYRSDLYFKGWRSLQDPYPQDAWPAGTELDFSPLDFDAGSISSNITPAEFSSNLRVTVPALQQPVRLVFWGQIASVTSASEFHVGFCKVADIGIVAGLKAVRIFPSVPTAAAGQGTTALLNHRIAAGDTASDWTLAGMRISGTGTGQVRGDSIRSGGLQVLAA